MLFAHPRTYLLVALLSASLIVPCLAAQSAGDEDWAETIVVKSDLRLEVVQAVVETRMALLDLCQLNAACREVDTLVAEAVRQAPVPADTIPATKHLVADMQAENAAAALLWLESRVGRKVTRLRRAARSSQQRSAALARRDEVLENLEPERIWALDQVDDERDLAALRRLLNGEASDLVRDIALTSARHRPHLAETEHEQELRQERALGRVANDERALLAVELDLLTVDEMESYLDYLGEAGAQVEKARTEAVRRVVAEDLGGIRSFVAKGMANELRRVDAWEALWRLGDFGRVSREAVEEAREALVDLCRRVDGCQPFQGELEAIGRSTETNLDWVAIRREFNRFERSEMAELLRFLDSDVGAKALASNSPDVVNEEMVLETGPATALSDILPRPQESTVETASALGDLLCRLAREGSSYPQPPEAEISFCSEFQQTWISRRRESAQTRWAQRFARLEADEALVWLGFLRSDLGQRFLFAESRTVEGLISGWTKRFVTAVAEM